MTPTQPQPETRIVALGEILWDLLPQGPRLGGTTANFTIGCARLGRPATLISSLGHDTWGDRARQLLADTQTSGVALLETDLIQQAPDVPTGLVEVTLAPNGQPTYNIAMPAAWDHIQATPAALHAVRHASAICFGTLCQRAAPSRQAIRQLVEATSPTCTRVLDVNVRMPFFSDEVARWSLAHATVAKISDEELHAVAHAVGLNHLPPDDSLEAIQRCGRVLLHAHPHLHLLAITLGARGSLLLSPSATQHHPGFPITVADTVGAGDAFTAGLVHAWLAGASLPAINQVGNLCGSFVASQPGATPRFPASLLADVQAALTS